MSGTDTQPQQHPQPQQPQQHHHNAARLLLFGATLSVDPICILCYRKGKEACDICYRGMCYLAHIVLNTIQMVRGVHDNQVSGYNRSGHLAPPIFGFVKLPWILVGSLFCFLFSFTFSHFFKFMNIFKFLNLFNSWWFLKFVIFF